MSVGDNIRRIRESKQISQYDLAERVGISQPMISQIEKGIKFPSLLVAAEIARICDCPVEALIEEPCREVEK